MARILFLVLAFVFAINIHAQTPQKEYIEKYAQMAVAEMYRSGVPASITLAQGMLESGNGRSSLAIKANNHFGIKCHNGWAGGRVYHDDDAKGECFRKYDAVVDSYRDHSDFLRYRDRYKFLFDLKPTDYKGWAYGLKKAGYATDPSYPAKLIKLIEDYGLHTYDTYSAPVSASSTPSTQIRKSQKTVSIPQSPTVIEQVAPMSEQHRRKYFNFTISRQMYSKNGVPFIYSSEGESYRSIAKEYGLFLRELLRFNDMKQNEELTPGKVVYLQPKKNCAVKGLEKHIMEEGETIWDISQRYAVKLEKLYKINGLSEGVILKEGDSLKLRR